MQSSTTTTTPATGGVQEAGAGGTTITDAGSGGATPQDASVLEWSMLTLNLHCLKLDGTPYATNDDRFAAIAKAVAEHDVRVITVQEVCNKGTTSAMALLTAALEAATAAAWSSAWAFAHTGWQGTPDEAEEGVGVLVQGTVASTASLEFREQGWLRRVASAAQLPPELGGAWVVSVHLDYESASARTAQAREVATWGLLLGTDATNVVIAGDFNDTITGSAYAALPAFGYRAAPAAPAEPLIDHVFVHRAAPWSVVEATRLFDGATDAVSDHPGVLVRLAAAEPEAATLTRISALYNATLDEQLWLRGDAAPLDWGFGWPAHSMKPGRFELLVTEIPDGTAFEYKFLVDDSTWQSGDNSAGTAGTTNTTSPSFH